MNATMSRVLLLLVLAIVFCCPASLSAARLERAHPGEHPSADYLYDTLLAATYDATSGRVSAFTFSGLATGDDSRFVARGTGGSVSTQSLGGVKIVTTTFDLGSGLSGTADASGIGYPIYNPEVGPVSMTSEVVFRLSVFQGKVLNFSYDVGVYYATPGSSVFVSAVEILTDLRSNVTAPRINGPGDVLLKLGEAASFEISASGPVATYGASGLPPGLAIDPTTGRITGTPTKIGTFKVVLSASNSGGTARKTINVVVAPTQPKILAQPVSQLVERGSTATFSHDYTPRAPGFVKHQWWSYAERHAGLAAYPKAIPAPAGTREELVIPKVDWIDAGDYYVETTVPLLQQALDGGYARSASAALGVFERTRGHLEALPQSREAPAPEPTLGSPVAFIHLPDAISASVSLRALEFRYLAHRQFGRQPFHEQHRNRLYALPGRLVPVSPYAPTVIGEVPYYEAGQPAVRPEWLGSTAAEVGRLHLSPLTYDGIAENPSGERIGVRYRFSYYFDAPSPRHLSLGGPRSASLVVEFSPAQTAHLTDWANLHVVRWPVDTFETGAGADATARFHPDLNLASGTLAHSGDAPLIAEGLAAPALASLTRAFDFAQNPAFVAAYPDFAARGLGGGAHLTLPTFTITHQGWPYFQTPLFNRPDDTYADRLPEEAAASLLLEWGAVVETPSLGARLAQPPAIASFALQPGLVRTTTGYLRVSLVHGGGTPVSMRIGERPDLADAAWQPYRADFLHRPRATGPAKTLYAQLRNPAGTSAIAKAALRLSAPPTAGAANGFHTLVTLEETIAAPLALPLAGLIAGDQYRVTGLPPGVRYDSVARTLTGSPSKPGLYTLAISARQSGAWTAPASLTLRVAPLPAHAVGRFAFTAGFQPTATAALGGRLTLQIASSGDLTGRLVMGNREQALKARLVRDTRAGDGVPTAAIPFRLAGERVSSLLRLAFPPDGAPTAIIEDPAGEPSTLTGYQIPWDARARPLPSAWRFRLNAVSVLAEPEPIDRPVPAGPGLLTATANAAGDFSWRGRTPEGVAYTVSAAPSAEGEFGLWVPLYGAAGSRLGGLHARLALQPDTAALEGEVSQLKATVPASREYPLGFYFEHALTGGPYVAPAPATPLFTQTALVLDAAPLFEPLSVAYAPPARLTPAANAVSLKLTLVPSTGRIHGTARLGAPARTVSFEGHYLPALGAAVGQAQVAPAPGESAPATRPSTAFELRPASP